MNNKPYDKTDLKAIFSILLHRKYPAYELSSWRCRGESAKVNITAGSKKYRSMPVKLEKTDSGFMFVMFFPTNDKIELRLSDTEFYRFICDIRNNRPESINKYMRGE